MQTKKVLKFKFKKILVIYSIFIGILMLFFLGHVLDSLIKYESNQTEKYVLQILKNVCKNGSCNISNLNNLEKSSFDKDISIEASLEEIIKNGDLDIEEKISNKEETPVFQVKTNDNVILEVNLKAKKKLNRLGLLSFYIWESGEVVNKIEKGFYNYEINVPNTYKVYLNNKELTKNEITNSKEDEAFLEMSKYINIPYLVKYEINNLYSIPEINILDEANNSVQYENKGFIINKNLEFKSIKELDNAKKEIKNIPDIMGITKTWSLFMSNDLEGNLHGLGEINKFLITDSSLAKYARSWATNVDITFTSKHTFDNPKFSNELVSDFEVYNENAFSCIVYLEKNMIVRGRKQQDVMHDRLYFVNQNNEWKLVNMQAITERS